MARGNCRATPAWPRWRSAWALPARPTEVSAELMATVGLGLTLRDYQRQGVAWLQYLREQHLAGILADDMGLGKTAQVLAHLLIEKHEGRLDRPALVVLPTSLIANWQAEAARNAPALRVLTLQGAARSRDFKNMAAHDVVFTTYPLLWRDIDALRPQPWHLIVLDEAQMVKNAGSRAASALRRLQSRHRLCVTGTPLENHLGELWAHFDFLMPGFLGDARSFMRVWRKPIETNGETLRAELLARRVRPFILRRRKQDVATELKPVTEVIRRVQLQGRQRALYESVRVAADEQVRRVLKRQSFAGAQIAILDALLKLRQVCCDPRLVKGPKATAATADKATCRRMERAKMDLLRDMLPELVAEGRRVLVFSQFTEMLSLVEQELAELALPFLTLTGNTPVRARGAIVRQFQTQAVPVMLVSLKAGGVGLNLTAADTVIHLDPWWNPAVEQQATARAHRIGQDQPVFVYKLVVEGSIEERMLALQERKAALAEGVLGVDRGGGDEVQRRRLGRPAGAAGVKCGSGFNTARQHAQHSNRRPRVLHRQRPHVPHLRATDRRLHVQGADACAEPWRRHRPRQPRDQRSRWQGGDAGARAGAGRRRTRRIGQAAACGVRCGWDGEGRSDRGAGGSLRAGDDCLGERRLVAKARRWVDHRTSSRGQKKADVMWPYAARCGPRCGHRHADTRGHRGQAWFSEARRLMQPHHWLGSRRWTPPLLLRRFNRCPVADPGAESAGRAPSP